MRQGLVSTCPLLPPIPAEGEMFDVTEHEDRILSAVRALGPSGGTTLAVVRRAYRNPTPGLRHKTETTLVRLLGCRRVTKEALPAGCVIWRAAEGQIQEEGRNASSIYGHHPSAG